MNILFALIFCRQVIDVPMGLENTNGDIANLKLSIFKHYYSRISNFEFYVAIM